MTTPDYHGAGSVRPEPNGAFDPQQEIQAEAMGLPRLRGSYPTDTVMCSACSGTGEYDWGEIDVFSRCGTCDGVGEIEVCAQCHDSGEECAACGC